MKPVTVQRFLEVSEGDDFAYDCSDGDLGGFVFGDEPVEGRPELRGEASSNECGHVDGLTQVTTTTQDIRSYLEG